MKSFSDLVLDLAFPTQKKFQTKKYISQCLPDKNVSLPKENETIDETPYHNRQSNSTEKHNITMHGSFNRKENNTKKIPHVDGNVKLIKVMAHYHMHIYLNITVGKLSYILK